MRGWARYSVAIVAAFAMATTSCSGGERQSSPTDPATTANTDTTEAVIAQAAGVSINVPYSSLSSPDASLSIDTGTPPSEALASFGADIEPLGDVADVQRTGGELIGPATVTFDLPADFDDSRYSPGVVWETDTGWELLPIAWQPGDQQVVATTDHFSFGFPIRIDWSEAANSLTGWAEGLVTGRANIDNPVCGDEQAAREAGIEVVSDVGDLVKWCFGREDGRDVLKVANNWNAGVQVRFLKSWNVVEYQGAGASPQAIGDWLDSASRETNTTISRLIGSGQTIVLEPSGLDTGNGARVVAEISTVSWLWSIALQGIDMYLLTAKWLAVDTKDVRAEDLLTGAEFIKCYTEHYGEDIAAATAPIAPESFAQVVNDTTLFALSCGEDVIRDYLGTLSGLAARVGSVAVGVIAAAVGIVYGLVNAGFAGIRGLIDEIGGLFDDTEIGGSGYDIVLLRSSSPSGVAEIAADGLTAALAYDHPTLGSVTIQVVRSGGGSAYQRFFPSVTAVVDATGNRIFEWFAQGDFEEFDFWGLAPEDDVDTTVDALGHIFLKWNPGRFTGVSVLIPTSDGFDSIGTLTDDFYDGYYYAFVVDVDNDGVFELNQAFQVCEPTCAEGADYSHIWRWNGSSYAGPSDPPETATGPGLEDGVAAIRSYLLAAGARSYEEAWSSLSTSYQARYGSYESFVSFWDRVDNVGIDATSLVGEIAGNPPGTTVEAALRYALRDGSTSREIVHIDVTRINGELTISDYRFVRQL